MPASRKAAMVRAARAAGDIIRARFGRAHLKERKADKSIVTEVDRRAEEEIIRILTRDFPYRVIAEESGARGAESEYTWVIDPLDGTSNFTRGIPLFCTSIALLRGGEACMGVIYHPITDELFFAGETGEATLNGRPVRAARAAQPKSYIFHDALHASADIGEFFSRITPVFSGEKRSERNIGTSALALAYVASCKGDAFIGYGQELWDVAAALLICGRAGLTVTDWEGRPWRRGASGLLVADAGLHRTLVRLLRKREGDGQRGASR